MKLYQYLITICLGVLLLPVNSWADRFDSKQDLLLAQFDTNRDPDDIHAIAALGCLLAHDDYADVKYLAVHGAYGIQKDENFIPSPQLFEMVFGKEDETWVNASPQDPEWNGAVAKIAAKVKPVLNAGGKVWVAEAGQSDITADWVKALLADGVSAELIKANVIVVQHSDWNENHTAPDHLSYVKKMCTYQVINDGNGNATKRDPAAPATPSYRSVNKDFQQEALNSPNQKTKSFWIEAKRVIDEEGYFPKHSSISTGGVDFSDVVESHWILGSSSDYDTIRKFWDKFVINTP